MGITLSLSFSLFLTSHCPLWRNSMTSNNCFPKVTIWPVIIDSCLSIRQMIYAFPPKIHFLEQRDLTWLIFDHIQNISELAEYVGFERSQIQGRSYLIRSESFYVIVKNSWSRFRSRGVEGSADRYYNSISWNFCGDRIREL